MQSAEKKKSFSLLVKSEIWQNRQEHEYREDELAMAFMAQGKYSASTVHLASTFQPYMMYLQDILRQTLDCNSQVRIGNGIYTLELTGKHNVNRLRHYLLEHYAFEASRGKINTQVTDYDEKRKLALLRGLFMICGSFSEPNRAYHLEFSIRRLTLAKFSLQLLAGAGINAGLIKRYGYNVLYVKDADQLGNFLALMGAALAYLEFEARRVEKDVNNKVNRIVNCDAANARRIADSSARQLEQISRLRASEVFLSLSPALQESANLRITYPGLSIGELAAMQTPPIGKSGMYHRLKKLETLAHEIDT